MNKVILMGRLTRDPEVRYSQGENSMAIARYTIAVDRRVRRDGDQQTADFINCVAFGRSGEFAESKSASANNAGAAAANGNAAGSAIGDGFMNLPDGIDEELPFV